MRPHLQVHALTGRERLFGCGGRWLGLSRDRATKTESQPVLRPVSPARWLHRPAPATAPASTASACASARTEASTTQAREQSHQSMGTDVHRARTTSRGGAVVGDEEPLVHRVVRRAAGLHEGAAQRGDGAVGRHLVDVTVGVARVDDAIRALREQVGVHERGPLREIGAGGQRALHDGALVLIRRVERAVFHHDTDRLHQARALVGLGAVQGDFGDSSDVTGAHRGEVRVVDVGAVGVEAVLRRLAATSRSWRTPGRRRRPVDVEIAPVVPKPKRVTSSVPSGARDI